MERSWVVELRVRDPDNNSEVHAEELARRLLGHFPQAVIDRPRADAYVQSGLERLIDQEAPDVILEAHRRYFGNVIFASVSDEHWEGVTATSYLHTMWPDLGDTVSFEMNPDPGSETGRVIANELAVALDMVVCDP